MKTHTTAVLLVLLLSLGVAPAALADDGLIKKKSPHGVTETIDRLQGALESKGITIVVRWKHSDKAAGAGIEMRPTELLVFGNPKLGSHLMTSAQSVGIDLPMKALAWQDASGQVWLAYNDPDYIAARHGITDRPEIIAKMTKALNAMTDKAIAP